MSCVSEENDDASSTALCDTQQQTSPPSTPDEPVPIPEDVFEARIVIHSALHLQTERPLSSSVYVTLHPHPNVAKVSTLAVSTEQSMIWDHHCVTYIPNMYLQPVVSIQNCIYVLYVLVLVLCVCSALDWNYRCGASLL